MGSFNPAMQEILKIPSALLCSVLEYQRFILCARRTAGKIRRAHKTLRTAAIDCEDQLGKQFLPSVMISQEMKVELPA
jgi:hypothetical protein